MTKKSLLALAQDSTESSSYDADDVAETELGAPAAAVYKSRSEGIVNVLEDLREKAETQLAEARKAETNASHNHNLLKQSLTDQIAANTKEMGETKASSAEATETKATAEGDLAQTQKGLDEATQALKTLTGSCKTADSDYEATAKSLSEELAAVVAAKKAIMESVAGAASATYGDASFFLQVNSSDERSGTHSWLATRADLANFEVVNLLRQLAKKEGSSALMQLAGRVSDLMRYGAGAGEDPFAKVKALITDMVRRLEREAGIEATHKAYCDKEMGTTQDKIDNLKGTLEVLKAKVDKKKSLSVQLKDDIKELQHQLAKLAKSQVDLNEVRKQEHEAFIQTKVDLEAGLQGVRQAVKILREYYANANKESGAASGIIGMLEVIESDFGKGLAEAETNEDSSAAAYQKISMTNRITKAMSEKDVEYKTKESASLDKSAADYTSDIQASQTELDAVLQYSKTIREQCVAKPETYEERKGRREAEIAGLKEALSILEGEAVLIQQHKNGVKDVTSLLRR